MTNFPEVARNISTPRFLGSIRQLSVPVSTIIDMGELEQQQVRQVFASALGEYAIEEALARVVDAFGISIRPQATVYSSPLVSPLGSSFRVDDVVGKARELLRVKNPESPEERIFAGLRHFLGGGLAAHVAPRDRGDGEQENGNHLGEEFFAVLKGGEIISSVGNNSLLAVKDRVHELVAVNHAFIAAAVAADKGESTTALADARSRIGTQYTACYVRPFMEAALFKSKIETLLAHNAETLGTLLQSEEGRRTLSVKALAHFIASLESARPRVAQILPQEAGRPITRTLNPEVIPAIPHDVVTKVDDYGIVNFTLSRAEWISLRGEGPNREVFVSLRAADGTLTTHTATIKPSSFDGAVSQLVLAPSAHEDHAGDNIGTGRVELNMFARAPSGGFSYAQSPAARFGNVGRTDDKVSAGTLVAAVTPVDVVAHLSAHLGLNGDAESLKALQEQLVHKGLVVWTDHRTLENPGTVARRLKQHNGIEPFRDSRLRLVSPPAETAKSAIG